MNQAAKNYFRLYPLPSKHLSLPIDRVFNREEMDLIKKGLIPRSMDDRWYVYFEDSKLYWHRSWTGYCCFVANFKEQHDGTADLFELLASRDEQQYGNTNDAEDVRLLNSLIDELLLSTPYHY